jgi:hypothetical protein
MTRSSGTEDFYKTIKNALKRGHRKEQKRKSLLRTLTANRLMAERGRFELPAPCGAAVFETATFDLSDISPYFIFYTHSLS